jgi:hypothetical protein
MLYFLLLLHITIFMRHKLHILVPAKCEIRCVIDVLTRCVWQCRFKRTYESKVRVVGYVTMLYQLQSYVSVKLHETRVGWYSGILEVSGSNLLCAVLSLISDHSADIFANNLSLCLRFSSHNLTCFQLLHRT